MRDALFVAFALRALQVDRVLERVSGTAPWQHTRRRSGRRKRPDSGAVPRQAGLFPRLGDMLGELRRRTSLPSLATERHSRCQRRMVHRVSLHTVYLSTRIFNLHFLHFLTMCMYVCAVVVRPRRSIRRSGTRSSRTGTTSAATGS